MSEELTDRQPPDLADLRLDALSRQAGRTIRDIERRLVGEAKSRVRPWASSFQSSI